MMSMSVIAPAFAASPWKDLWLCRNSGAVAALGTEAYIKNDGINDCATSAPELLTCDPKGSSNDGHIVFKDSNADGIWQFASEKDRCVKN